MTEEMLDLARANARAAAAGNVEFLRGQIEAIPLPDRSVDVGSPASPISPTHQVADGVHAAIIRAARP